MKTAAARGTLRAVLALGGLGIVAFWWTNATPGFTSSPAAFTTKFGELAGLVAAYFVCVQVLLIARVPWFERAVGLDRLVAWHRTVGTTTLLLVLSHVGLMILGQMLLSRQTPWTAYASVFTNNPDMLTALVGTIVFVAVGLSSVRLLRRVLPYELWYWVHVTTYGAIFLTFLHQISAGADFVGDRWHQALWWAMYLFTAACVVIWRFALPLVRLYVHRFSVVRIDAESPRMTSVWIRAHRLADLDVKAGHFMIFRFLQWGHLLSAHPYSISNVPESDFLRITVADLGDHSSALRGIRPGTTVIAEGPFGTFTADQAGKRPILLVAGGAGIGPIRSLAEEFALRGRGVVVVYRSSAAADLALYDELRGLQVRVVPLVGRRSELGYDPLSARVLKHFISDVETREAFVCGPPAMTETAVESLRELGVPGRRIHAEELSLS